MNFPEKIKTISKESEAVYKEKGSEFIANAFPVLSETEAINFLDELKKKFYYASHHCYAFKLKDGTIKFSDDREPSGTAGKRILNAIEHFDLTDILIIVIRYFGGTKLGVGPLGNAYYTAALESIEANKIVTKELFIQVTIKSDFDNMKIVYKTITEPDAKIVNSHYDKTATFDCMIKPAAINSISQDLINQSGGKIMIKNTGEKTYI